MARMYKFDDALEHFGYQLFNLKLFAICSLLYFCVGIQVTNIFYLTPLLNCEWDLSAVENVTVSIAMFIGMFFGAPYWGSLLDKFGRRRPLLFSMLILAYFGLLKSNSPSVLTYSITSGLIGICLACFPTVAIVYCVEYSPMKYRGKETLALLLSYIAGGIFSTLLAYYELYTIGWKYFLTISVTPVILCILLSLWLPESCRYLQITGEYNETVALLNKISIGNKSSLPKGILTRKRTNADRGKMSYMFSHGYVLTTLPLLLIVAICFFNYATTAVLSSQLIRTEEPFAENGCIKLKNLAYSLMASLALADVVACLIAVLIMENFRRKVSMAFCFLLTAICYAILIFNVPSIVYNITVIASRAIAPVLVQFALLYVAEFYPTYIRTSAIGMSLACGMLSVIGGKFLVQFLLTYSFLALIIALFGLMIFGILCLVVVPLDTRGKRLRSN